MKKYVTPEMEIKSLVQDVTVVSDDLPDGEYGGQVTYSTPNTWWPF